MREDYLLRFGGGGACGGLGGLGGYLEGVCVGGGRGGVWSVGGRM